MKKLMILLLILALGVTGCKKELSNVKKYQYAVKKYENGDFEEAKNEFLEISNYEDSSSYIKKAEVMSKLQGTYANQSDGVIAFTVNKFDVLNWDEGTTIELQDSCTKLFFRKEKGDAEYNISFLDGKVILMCKMPLITLKYEKIE